MVKICGHSHWLSLSHTDGETSIHISNRLNRLTERLPDADRDCPSMLMLVGNKTKSAVIRSAFGVKRVRFCRDDRRAGDVHLNVDPSSTKRPILIADAALTPEMMFSAPKRTQKCHQVRSLSMTQLDELEQPLQRRDPDLHYSLLAPFVDVYVLFSTDMGGLRQVASLVSSWLDAGTVEGFRPSPPRLMVVTDQITAGKRVEEETRRVLLHMIAEETSRDIFSLFSTVEVVSLKGSGSTAKYRLLKERVMAASDHVRHQRELACMLFSATHFRGFFDLACNAMAKGTLNSFNFIKASRADNPVAHDLSNHIRNAIRQAKSYEQLVEFVVPIIASSLLLDSYPPDAPVFAPEDVYSTLYASACGDFGENSIMFEETDDIILRAGFVKLVREQFRLRFDKWTADSTVSVVELHRQLLAGFQEFLKSVSSTESCLCCNRRRPSISLPGCHHCVDETCVALFGIPDFEEPSRVRVRKCLICQVQIDTDVLIKIDRPTEGVGVMCIDGGGSRGVYALRMMQRVEAHLQEKVGGPIQLQDVVKVFSGISTGALIGAGILFNGWTVEYALRRFPTLAKKVFRRRKWLMALFCWLRDLGMAACYDGIYPAKQMEDALKEAFGVDQSIMDYSHAKSMGTKIGFPVATVHGRPSRRIFTNYNGTGAEAKNLGDTIIKPGEGLGRVPLWQVMRAASAAPCIFPPMTIPGIGTFQDAGPLENDPALSALRAVRELYPHLEEPDFIASFGTGEPERVEDAQTGTEPALTWKNNGLFRLISCCWEKMRDENVRESLSHHSRYIRFNTQFSGPEPRLDSVHNMASMDLQAANDKSLCPRLEEMANRAVASCFYFELSDCLKKRESKHEGQGTIRCKLGPRHVAFKPLLKYLQRIGAKFYLDDREISTKLDMDSCLDHEGRFLFSVPLKVEESFKIRLRQHEAAFFHISASPFSVSSLESVQRLGSLFGHPDHRKRQRPHDCRDSPSKRVHL